MNKAYGIHFIRISCKKNSLKLNQLAFDESETFNIALKTDAPWISNTVLHLAWICLLDIVFFLSCVFCGQTSCSWLLPYVLQLCLQTSLIPKNSLKKEINNKSRKTSNIVLGSVMFQTIHLAGNCGRSKFHYSLIYYLNCSLVRSRKNNRLQCSIQVDI